MVSPAGIEPATPGLGNLTGGLYKCLKIPDICPPIKALSGFYAYI